MSARSTIRRMTLVCAGAVAVLVMSAGVAAAQSAEDCDQLGAIPELGEQLSDGCQQLAEQVEGGEGEEGDEGDEGGDEESSPLDDLLGALEEQGLDPEEVCALREEAPEEFEAVLDALGPVVNELCPPEEDSSEEEPEDTTPDAEEPADESADTVDASTSGELPNTGGLAGLAGLGMLGAGAALRRLRATGTDVA